MRSEIKSSSIVSPMLGDATPFVAVEAMGEVLQRVAVSYPNHDALRWLGGRMSHAEFNARTNAIAADLIKHGVRPGEIVGVSFGRSPEYVMLVAAIIKAGAAYLPLDESLPEERLRILLEQTLPWHVVTPPGTRLGWARLFCNVWEADAAFFDKRLDHFDLPKVSPETTAYILFTSGSTGVPKAVEVVQRGILALVFGGHLEGFGPDDVFLHHSSLSFDASTIEIWGGLLRGACLALYCESYPSIEKLDALIKKCSVAYAFFSTTYFNVVVDAAPEILKCIRRIDTGGELMSVPHITRAQQLLPETTLYNVYGPTECTVYSMGYRIPRPLSSQVKEVPIGTMLRHWFGYVLDDQGRPIAQGEVGELHIGGAGLAKGYLHPPPASERSFYNHESLDGCPRLYRTGDLVRVGEDGLLYFCGRADSQIKLRGFRIELGEIERRLVTHAAVKQAIVLLGQTAAGDNQLVAFTVAAAPFSTEELRAHVASGLPQHMVPTRFYAIDSVPLRASGKCDTKALWSLADRLSADPVPRESVPSSNPVPDPIHAQVALDWQRVQRPFPSSESVQSVFSKIVERNGASLALVDGVHRLTYSQLDGTANTLARELLNRGLAIGSTVGLFLPRSAEFVVAVLATLKLGCAYVPLDINAPESRLSEMVADAQLGFILALPGSSIPDLGAAPIYRVDLGGRLPSTHPPLPPENTDGSARAYVMYTSGSTGRPKGVVISHASILRLSIGQVYQRCVQGLSASLASSVTFDVSVSEIWPTLLNAGELHVYRESVADIQALRDFLRSSQVEVFQITTALFHLVVDEDPLALTGPRLIVVVGEALSVSHCARLYAVLSGVTIINAYGPTETTVYSHAFWVPRRIPPSWSSVPIGYPIFNTLALVCDEQMKIVPSGTEGFLWLGGPGLAAGYLNLPSLTEEVFVPNPFATPGVARLYRTGDRVFEHPDGSLEFKGRNDNQIKLRGFRIELGEVEHELVILKGVARAVTCIRTSPSGQRKLIGYVVMLPGFQFSESDLLANLGQSLTEAMVPSHLVCLEVFPLNSSGKVNRAALPSPLWSADIPAAEISGDPVYRCVHALWDEVLGGFNGDGTASFFEIGGDSLDASRVLVRLRQTHGVHVSLGKFLSNPTLAGLVEAARPEFVETTVPANPQLQATLRYAPSSFQRRQIFEWSLNPRSHFGNLSYYLLLPEVLDEPRLRSAFERIISKNDILRTRYEISDEEMMASVDTSMPVDFRCVHHSAAMDEHSLIELLRAESELPYNLRCGPIIRMSVHYLPGPLTCLHFMVHHVAFDGWTLPILLRDFQAFYHGAEATLPDRIFDYSSFAAWEASQNAAHADGVAFWRTALAGFQPLLPLRPIRDVLAQDCICERIVWPDSVANAIRLAVATYKTSTLNILSSALQIVLGHWLRVEDLTIGTVMAVRPTVEAESTFGFFVNPVFLRCKANIGRSLLDFVEDNHRTVFEALSHSDIPFEDVVARCGLNRPAEADRWFDVMLVHQSNTAAVWDYKGRKIPVLEIQPRDTPFSVVLSVAEIGGHIEVLTTLRTDRVSRADFAGLLDAWTSVLGGMASAGDQLLGEIAAASSNFGVVSLERRVESEVGRLNGVVKAIAVARSDKEIDLVVVSDGTDQPGMLSRLGSVGSAEGVRVWPLLVPVAGSDNVSSLGRTEAIQLIQSARRLSEAPLQAPGDPIHLPLARQIAKVAGEILGCSEIGLDDDFFRLGGSSLSGLRLVLRMGRELKVLTTLGDVLRLRTPLSIAGGCVLQPLDKDGKKNEVLTILPDSEPVRLSPAQQRLWFLYRASPSDGSYHIEFILAWKTPLSVEAATRAAISAWEDLVRSHESLRSRIVDRDGQGFLDVAGAEGGTVTVVDCPNGLADVRRHLLVLGGPAFDLFTHKPFRCAIYQLPEGRFALGVVVHHLFFDGWSLNQLSEEFLHLLQDPSRKISARDSYRRYAFDQWALRATDGFGRVIEFWKRRLDGVHPVLDLGSNRTADAASSTVGGLCLRVVNKDLLNSIRAYVSASGITLYTYLLAAAALMSARASGQRKFILGCISAGRESLATSSLVGFCVNTIPVVIDSGGGRAPAQFVSSVRRSLAEALADDRATLTLDEIVAAVRPSRIAGIDPLIQVVVTLEESPAFVRLFPQLEPTLEIGPGTFAPFEITIQGRLEENELKVTWSYRRSVYNEARINELAEAYTKALADLLCLEDIPLSYGWHDEADLPAPARTNVAKQSAVVPAASDVGFPMLPIYKQLQEIWQQLLGVPCVGVTQDFFDLGGHSLLALQLIQKIKESFGVSLSVETLFESRTISTLAQAISGKVSAIPGKPVLLQAGTGAGQVIYFHGDLSSGGLYARDLFKDLLPGWEVWAVHPVSSPMLPSGLPEIAEQHLIQIGPILKSGPIVLGGFCLSGWIAYEVAAKLVGKGHRVPQVFLIDTLLPLRSDRILRNCVRALMVFGFLDQPGAVELFRRQRNLLERAVAWWKRNRSNSPREWFNSLRHKFPSWFPGSSDTRETAVPPLSSLSESPLEVLDSTATESMLLCAANYTPPAHVNLPVALALSAEACGLESQVASDWSGTPVSPECRFLPGSHVGIITNDRRPLRAWIMEVVHSMDKFF